MIKLGYLEGYNKFNQIRFTSKEQQDTFFSSITTYSIDAYYPPYFTNIIKLDIDEVPQSAPINFVILVHNNKSYYYFIEDIEYINEEVYNIKIVIDTIQTFMFDIKIKHGIITRSSIARWISSNINRDYIPENVSTGYFINNSYTDISSTIKGFTQVLSTYDYPTSSSQTPKTYEPVRLNTAINGRVLAVSPYSYLYYYPTTNSSDYDNIHITIYDTNSQVLQDKTYTKTEYFSISTAFYGLDSTKNIRNVVNEYLKTIQILEFVSSNTLNLRFTVSNEYMNFRLCEVQLIGTLTPCFCVMEQSEKVYTTTRSITYNGAGFSKNTNENKLFDITNTPQIIDENYMNVVYGEKSLSSQYPLRKIKSTTIKCSAYYDMLSGNRSYGCYSIDDDVYNTFKTCAVGNECTLFSSKWDNYQMTHKASLTDGYVLAQTNNAINFMRGTVNAMHSPSTVSFYGKAIDTTISYGQNYYNTYKEREILRDDLMATPDDMGNLTDIMSANATNSVNNIFAIYTISDIESCCKYFEENGYKVHTVYNGDNYMCDIILNRKNFNVVNIENIEISNNCIIPNMFISDIKNRLSYGIRFFDMNRVISKGITTLLTYDNADIQ